MKLLFALAGLLYYSEPSPNLFVLDKDFKRPVQRTTAFTTEQYMQQNFPVYASDIEAIITATDSVVKQLDNNPICHSVDTIFTPHTVILVATECAEKPKISVTLITRIEESKTSFAFAVVKREQNRRKAQQRLLNLGTYLSR